MPITSLAGRTGTPSVSPSRSGSPTSRTDKPCSTAWRAPNTISSGALSPPIASTATGAMPDETGPSADVNGLPPAVPPTVGADDVRQLGLPAIRADAARRRVELPRAGPAAAALGLGGLLLGYGHLGGASLGGWGRRGRLDATQAVGGDRRRAGPAS